MIKIPGVWFVDASTSSYVLICMLRTSLNKEHNVFKKSIESINLFFPSFNYLMFTYYVPSTIVKTKNNSEKDIQVPTIMMFTWQWGSGSGQVTKYMTKITSGSDYVKMILEKMWLIFLYCFWMSLSVLSVIKKRGLKSN